MLILEVITITPAEKNIKIITITRNYLDIVKRVQKIYIIKLNMKSINQRTNNNNNNNNNSNNGNTINRKL